MFFMIKKSIKDSIDDIVFNWNEEFKNNYPLCNRHIEEKLIDSIYVVSDGSYSLYKDNQYIGTVVLKFYNGVDSKYFDIAYISLIYVAKAFRKKGYGSLLLSDAINISKRNRKKEILIGADFDNLFSGVFVLDNKLTHQFFINNKFKEHSQSFNLTTKQRPVLDNDDYTYQIVGSENERKQTLDFIKRHFSSRWYDDCKDSTSEEFVVAIENSEIIGFVRITLPTAKSLKNSTNLYLLYQFLGGVGPLGINEKKRGLGIGKNLVKFAINTLFDKGVSDVLVDWTGLIDFYIKCGFEKVSNQYIGYGLEIDDKEKNYE